MLQPIKNSEKHVQFLWDNLKEIIDYFCVGKYSSIFNISWTCRLFYNTFSCQNYHSWFLSSAIIRKFVPFFLKIMIEWKIPEIIFDKIDSGHLQPLWIIRSYNFPFLDKYRDFYTKDNLYSLDFWFQLLLYYFFYLLTIQVSVLHSSVGCNRDSYRAQSYCRRCTISFVVLPFP